MIIAGTLGDCHRLAEEFLPRHYAKWLPSATGLGIAGVIRADQSIALFLGALIAWIWMKAHRPSGERYIVAGSSGLIAGESLDGRHSETLGRRPGDRSRASGIRCSDEARREFLSLLRRQLLRRSAVRPAQGVALVVLSCDRHHEH